MAAYEPVEVGHVIADRYEILDVLGAGGFSAVYKARQLSTGKLVALKVLLPERLADPANQRSEIARFEREMRIIAGIKHPHVVPLIDCGRTADGQLFIVLEFIEGETLAGLLARQRRLPVRDATRLMIQALDALAAAHELGVVHRDFKPHNIMLTSSGMLRHAMVLDFGVAGVMEDCRADDYEELTGEGQVPGTPAYMAPEQIRTDTLDPRSDLYAWGLVYLEVLTGKKAVNAGSLAKTIAQQLSPVPVAVPPPLRDHPLGQILRQATAKDPALRYSSAAQILVDLERVALDDPLDAAMNEAFGQPRWRTPDELDEEPSIVSALVAGSGSDVATRARALADDDRAALPIDVALPQDDSEDDASARLTGQDRRTVAGPIGLAAAASGSGPSDTPLKGSVSSSSALRTVGRPWRGLLIALGAVAIVAVGITVALSLGSGRGSGGEPGAPAVEPAAASDGGGSTPHATLEPPAPVPSDTVEPVAESTTDVVEPDAIAVLPEPEPDVVEPPPEPVDAVLEANRALRALSLEELEVRCETDAGPACSHYAERLLAESGTSTEAYARAARQLEAACLAEDPHGCAGYGLLFDAGRGLRRSPQRAVELYEPACAAEVGLACRQLGLRRDASSAKGDRQVAHDLFEKACTLGDGPGCKELASFVERGRVGRADVPRALALYTRACELGDGHGCSRRAGMLEDGKGTPRDDQAAVRALEEACDLGYARGCAKLAYKLQHGKGVAPRPQEAVEFYARGCVLGFVDACSDGCWYIKNGAGVVPDAERAEAMCSRACEAGVQRACRSR